MKRTLLALACLLVLACSQADAQLINFELLGRSGAGLLPGNENPSDASGTASGDAIGLIFDQGTNELNINVVWGSANGFGDLTGDASAAHLHGAVGNDINSNAGVLINFASLLDASATSGGINGTVTLTSAQADLLLNGETYINVHTADNAGGELRGNLFAVPEPSSLAILGLLAGIGIVQRRRI